MDSELRKEPAIAITLSVVGWALAAISLIVAIMAGLSAVLSAAAGLPYSDSVWILGLSGIIGGLTLVGLAAIVHELRMARVLMEIGKPSRPEPVQATADEF